jgi:23S rRNA pseudouridine1911/1915/1917 synthase
MKLNDQAPLFDGDETGYDDDECLEERLEEGLTNTAAPITPASLEEQTLTLDLPESVLGALPRRLDWALSQLVPALSREALQQHIKDHRVTLEGQVLAKPAYKVLAGQQVVITLPAPKSLALVPYPYPLEVVYEDDALVVINKPIGMLTHPTGRHEPDTLVNALLHHCKDRLSSINGVIRPGIVHRLDKETEGLIVVAKTNDAHKHLSNQLRDRTMSRAYQAIVQGCPSLPQGQIEADIARNPNHRQKMQVVPKGQGRWALTRWQIEQTKGKQFAWLRCELATGRTHQIRVHLTSLGYPLVGDKLYGTGFERTRQALSFLTGQALQAYELKLVHPVTKQLMAFKLPTSPRLASVWDAL